LTSFNPARLDEITERLGYRFRNHALLVEALTHGSTQKHKGDYQRLEFLGDRVLGLVIAEHLFRAHPGDEEGQLTHVLSSLVRSEACADAGDTIGLSDLVIIGTGERAKGMNLNRTVLGDAMEALVADAPGRRRMADSAYRAWQAHFTWERIADQYERLYRSLLDGEAIHDQFPAPPQL
jgi:dsRNA-specific ribonuclease